MAPVPPEGRKIETCAMLVVPPESVFGEKVVSDVDTRLPGTHDREGCGEET
jgi:hypothetical protein